MVRRFPHWAGGFTNSYTLAKLKLLTGGRRLWTRTAGSTLTGQAVDTAFLIVVTFGGVQPPMMLLRRILSLSDQTDGRGGATPVTNFVAGWLKRAEVNAFDRRTDCNPFVWQAGERLGLH